MTYRQIVFLQNNEAEALLNTCEDNPAKIIESLIQDYDYGEGEETDYEPWGSSDETFKWENYVLSWNSGLGYVALTEVSDD